MAPMSAMTAMASGPGDEGGAEPVELLALVEDDLERGETDADEGEAGAVDLQLHAGAQALGFFSKALAGEVLGVGEDHAGEEGAARADGDVDVEDPAPGVVVGDPAAEGGAEHGRAHDGDGVDGHRHAALVAGEEVGENGLHGGLKASASEALQHAKDDQQAERRGDAAERGEDREHRDRDEVEVLAADDRGDPAADGEDDRVGDEIAGEHPGALVLRGGEAAGDVREGYVGDGGVEHLHERAHGDDEGDDPGIEGAGARCCRRSGAGRARTRGRWGRARIRRGRVPAR